MRPKIGDLIEIPTTVGFSYAQYTHKHPQYGALLRVFPGVFEKRPSSYSKILASTPLFSCFFPLNAAIREEIVAIANHGEVPTALQEFPIFRAGAVNPELKRVQTWWLWDGEKEWPIGDLNPDQRKLPIRGVWNDTLLKERIVSGWTPEKDELTSRS